ncbi:hypothetical protein CTRI78_v003792 [Colletotrichum trifolii]|uniref:Zn(2)-C6 fungal-type domain-containing protein n=1 Tax=Colletotrichum trifolii TaxID=5466 RepID=A0A4R8RIU2_COLTR|nr:hypothetical protein CTRI78_v003792 [Colletotrichum trifolii]
MPDQNLRRLLPAPQASQPIPSRLPPASSRRRNTNTKVACNACRSKKKACDGRRPICGTCAELDIQCVYISVDEKETPVMALKRENQALKTLLTQLKTMPPEVVSQTLKGLNFAVDPNAGIRSVRPSGWKDPRDFIPHLHSNVEFELMRRHPAAYPLVTKTSRVRSPESTDPRPSKMARITEVSDSASSSPEPSVGPSDIMTGYPRTDASGSSVRFRLSAPDTYDAANISMSYPIYTDPRLKDLDIGFWTAVPVPNEEAVKIISLYLETDHAILVSAMLSFACQAFATYNPLAHSWSQQLQDEAHNIWHADKEDSLTTVAALAFMVQSVGCNGDGELDIQYIQDTAAMAKRLKLFGCPDACTLVDLSLLSEDEATATSQVAWGVFSTLSMVAQFYLPATTEYPPALPIPGKGGLSKPEASDDNAQPTRDVGLETLKSDSTARSRRKRDDSTPASETFAAFCDLWVISSGITWFYQQNNGGAGRVAPAFALTKYNKLLSWAANLSDGMVRREDSPRHVLICHMWFHGTILYLFRPLIPTDKQHGITSWSPSAPAMPAIFAASLEQLKDLVEVYMLDPTVPNTIFWHTALMHVANAAANDTSDLEWRYYFFKCMTGYWGLYRSFTVAGVIARGLLAMAVRKGALGTAEGYEIVQELRAKKSRKLLDGATGLFASDLDLAVTDREAARTDRLIKKFEELTVLEEFTVGIT